MEMNNYRTDCYFYYESQEMGALVPNCSYDTKYEYGFCPCSENCKHYISRKKVYELVKGLVRCKDCKWFIKKFENEGRCIKHDNDYHDPDWFCADGERRIN